MEVGLGQTKILAQQNWKVASAFLAEVVQFAAGRVPSSLVDEVRQAERASTIETLLNDASRSGSAVDSNALHLRLTEAVKRYPGEAVLESRLAALNAAVEKAAEDAKRRRGFIEFAALANQFEMLEDPALVSTFAELSAAIAKKYAADSQFLSKRNGAWFIEGTR